MTVNELIDYLSSCDPDQRVMIATQPGWPLAFEVGNVVPFGPDDDPDDDHHNSALDAVWITTGGAPYPDPYAPGVVFDG